MSTLPLASIQRIVSVEKHPNADSLDLAKVLGYICIVKRDTWSVGDLCVFIQPDSVLPDAPWAAFYKAKSSRIKAIRLRGSWSFGVIESPSNVGLSGDLVEGTDVTDTLGVTKYEEPQPQDLSAKGGYPFGIPKTDESRWQSFRDNELPWGELVDVTVKVDGQSLSYLFEYQSDTDSYNVSVGGRSFIFHPEVQNNYTRNITNLNAADRIISFLRANGNVSLCFRGESYGVGIQKSSFNPHSKQPLGLAFFSVWNIDERKYERKGDKFYIHSIAAQLGLPTVEVIERDVPLTKELIKKYDEELETINGVPFEGVVIQHKDGSFKVLSKYYDSKK